ncbi:MAG: peptide ABC transporter substrate-binding protein [Ruminococcaceae bacterium]|nr:peptide ABC transporter substrate-binding protein [Oscillospiraceae bacterium]
MKKVIAVMLVLASVFSLTSCSKINQLFSGNQEQSFSYPIAEMPVSIDPQIAQGEAELIIIENCMEGLVRLNAKGEVIPAVAKSWDISADGLQYTFHLNPQAAWAVDTEDEDFEIKNFNKRITANDFVFAVSRAVLKETQAPDFESVSLIKNAHEINESGTADTSSLGIKALDESTLVIRLESANSDFLKSLSSAVFMPCSEQFFDYCAGRYGRQADYFLSNAGFTLRAWNETNLVMRKNEDYALPNPAKADAVTLYRDENAFESFKNDNYDALAVDDDKIDEALADKSLNVQSYDDTVWCFALNCDGKLCSYQSLRQALMLSVNREALQAPDWGKAAVGVVPNICTAGGENYRSAAGEAAIPANDNAAATEKYQTFYEKYKEDTDEEDLPVFRLLCTAGFDANAKQIVQNWQMNFGTGFEVKIQVLSLDEIEKEVQAGNYDGVMMPVSADNGDALVFLKKFAGENEFGYESNAFLEALNEDGSEVAKCLKSENILLNDGAIYPLFTANSYYVQRNQVEGIYFYAFGGKVNFLGAERAK